MNDRSTLLAFYQQLKETLVATDFEQAVRFVCSSQLLNTFTDARLAYAGGERWRVVTLDGQLIEISGLFPFWGVAKPLLQGKLLPELVVRGAGADEPNSTRTQTWTDCRMD